MEVIAMHHASANDTQALIEKIEVVEWKHTQHYLKSVIAGEQFNHVILEPLALAMRHGAISETGSRYEVAGNKDIHNFVAYFLHAETESSVALPANQLIISDLLTGLCVCGKQTVDFFFTILQIVRSSRIGISRKKQDTSHIEQINGSLAIQDGILTIRHAKLTDFLKKPDEWIGGTHTHGGRA